MAGPSYGSGSEGYEDVIRRAQQASQAQDELNRREEQRRASEERTQATEQTSSGVRRTLSDSTTQLTSRISANAEAVNLETAAFERSNLVLARAVELRRTLSGIAVPSGRSAALGAGTTGAAPIAEDPAAASRLRQAETALAAAELQRARSQSAVRAAQRGTTTTAEDLAPLVARREAAGQAVQAARGELRAAQANVAAQEELAAQRAQATSEQARINEALAVQRRASEQAAAATQAEVSALTEAVARVRAGQLGAPTLSAGAARYLAASGASLPPERGSLDILRGAGYTSLERAARFAPSGIGVTGGPVFGPRVPSEPRVAGTEELEAYRREATANAEALAGMGAAQTRANQAFQEASAVYADASTRLSRHGALTTEFIGALARGQVTLGEFGSQLTATIGKFGGWAIAASAVYGVVKLFEDVRKGASATQDAVAQLGRFLPGLGGPAGGGTGQVNAAESLVRNISTQFNVPISEVSSAMLITARVFHNLADAGEAARAVLAASRLDQVPEAQGTQFLLGIAQAEGFTRGGQVTGVVNSLNALQAQYGARVSQSLPGVARAVPAAQFGNLPLPNLEALVGLGVTRGLTGNVVGQAITRSITNFAFRATNQPLFAGYGIQVQPGNYQKLISDVFNTIGERSREGRLGSNDLRNLAVALGGPQLSRVFAPLLEAEARRPGTYQAYLGTAERPRPYTEDLNAALGQVSERFKRISIDLQGFGSELVQFGGLTAVIALLDAINFVAHQIRALVSPIADAVGVFQRLPSVVQDVIGAFVGFRVLSALYRTSFGGTAQAFVGRLPGLSALGSQDRGIVEGAQARLQTYEIPAAQAQYERSARNLADIRGRVASAQAALAESAAANAAALQLPLEHPARVAAEEDLSERRARIGALQNAVPGAERNVQETGLQLANLNADLAAAKDTQYTWAERAALLEQRGYVAQQASVDVQEQITAARLQQLEAIRTGTLGGGLGGAAAGGAAASAAATKRAVQDVARDPAVMNDVVAGAAAATAAGAAAAAAARTSIVPEGAPAGTTARYAALEQVGLGGLVQGLQSRVQSLSQSVESAGGLRGYLGQYGGALPVAGLIGTQLLGGALGGGVGDAITTQGGTAAGGALLFQMLGRSPLLGAGLGLTLANLTRGKSNDAGLGSILGGVTGGLIGSIIEPGGGTAVGAGLGSAIGSTIGGLFGQGGGGGQPDVSKAQQQAAQILQSGQGNAQNLLAFGDQFSSALSTSFADTSSAGQAASAKVTTIIQYLTGQLSLFGSTSQQGRTAVAQMSQVVAALVDTAETNPAAATQLLQTAQGAFGSIAQRYTAIIKYAQTPAQGQQYLNQALGDISGVQSGVNQQLQEAEQQRALLAARAKSLGTYGGAARYLGGGVGSVLGLTEVGPDAAQVQAAQTQLDQKINNLKATTQALNALARDYAAQLADLQEQIAQQGIQSTTTLRQAGTSDQLRRTQIGIQGTQQQLRQLQGSRERTADPHTYAQQYAQLQQSLRQQQEQAVSDQASRIQARGEVAVQSIPSVDIVARAAAQVQEQAAIYNYLKDHQKLIDPVQLAQAYASLRGALQGLADATYQQNSELIQAQGQLAQAQAHGDPAGIAAAQAQTAQQLLAIARTPAQRVSAQAQIVAAGVAGQEATRQTAQLQGQVAQAQDYGNTVAQANDAIAAANRQLALAQNTQERLQAQAELLNANHQLQQALVDRYTQEGELAASQTVDPVQQAHDRLLAAAQALAHIPSSQVDTRRQAQTQLNNLAHQYEQGLIDQRSSVIQFQFQMMQISAQQAVHQLDDLLKLKGITLQQRQGILEQIRQYQLGLISPLGDPSQFDLAPGNIRLPTYYDVTHALRQAGAHGQARHGPVHAEAHTTINVYVAHEADVPKVSDAIDRATGSHLRGRLRAAGMRGS